MAKRKDISAERKKKRDIWLERTMRVTGFDEAKTRTLLATKRTQSFRLNPLRLQDTTLSKLHENGLLKTPVDWCKDGYELQNAAESLSEGHFLDSGEVFIQNAASWLPVVALDPKPGDIVLDVCAAPGGKASHIQAMTNNQSKLTCNDNSKPRLMKLQANMKRLGAEAMYTLCDATRLSRSNTLINQDHNSLVFNAIAQKTNGIFDKILLDAPCSGEGLMTLDNMRLFDSWSVAHIRRLSDLQKKILSESWQLLKPGGTLVYSTCTMAPEENEAVIDHLLRKHPDAKLEIVDFLLENRMPALSSWNDKLFQNNLAPCLRLIPGKLTEAFFIAKITKLVQTTI